MLHNSNIFSTLSFLCHQVQRQEINSRLGLENDNLLTEVLESHADVSINKWITTDDFNDETQPGFTQIDVEVCYNLSMWRSVCIYLIVIKAEFARYLLISRLIFSYNPSVSRYICLLSSQLLIPGGNFEASGFAVKLNLEL